MTPEESEPVSEHSVEIPSPGRRIVIVRRRSYPILALAAGLGLAGVLVGVFIVGRQRASDEHLTTDALQREELRDGWKALGAAAALDAQTASAPTATSAPPANVLIVNVPGQSGPQGPQGAPGQSVVVAVPGNATTLPNMSSSSPTQSSGVPGAAPVAGYAVPVTGYGVGAPAQPSPVSGLVPSGVVGQPVGNGSVPGSTSNPALPGNGSNGSAFATPASPNGAVNAPNPTSNLPGGTSNLPAGSSNLPTGSSNLPSGVP